MDQVIKLSDVAPLGSGEDRVVYPHPADTDLCIKIPRRPPGEIPIRGIRDTLFCLVRLGRKEFLDYNHTDVYYAQKLQRQGDPDLFRHIPRCHGYIETDCGQGVVWQRIRDYDERSCATLKEYKAPGRQLTAAEVRMLWKALQEFFSWQLRHGIMLREMAYTNTMICRLSEDTVRIYHIDAIGCADLLPLADHLHWFARLRVFSKVSRFRKRMIEWLGPPPK